MRVATVLSAAAIVALATTGPAFGFAKIKKTTTAPGYVLVRNDAGRASPFPNCESSPSCITETVKALVGRGSTVAVYLHCQDLGGCKVVGPR